MKNLTTKQQTELNNILESEDFKNIFDFEQEKKDLEKDGWNHKEVREFAKSLIKK